MRLNTRINRRRLKQALPYTIYILPFIIVGTIILLNSNPKPAYTKEACLFDHANIINPTYNIEQYCSNFPSTNE